MSILEQPGFSQLHKTFSKSMYISTKPCKIKTFLIHQQFSVNGIRCGFGNRDRFQLTWVNAVNFVVHPDYNPADLDNNIALIQLASNPTNSPSILPIPMAIPSTGQSAGYTGTIFGFGLNAAVQFPQILQQAYITITSDAECLQTFTHLNGRLDRTFCGVSEISPNTPNMCGGDQGGPFSQGGVLVIILIIFVFLLLTN